MRILPLTDPTIEAELTTTNYGDYSCMTLMFFCPVCADHYHLVPYHADGGKLPSGGHRWTHVSGDTLETLTLAPSYLATCGRGDKTCRLHIFVKQGKMQILSDSKLG